ncbi:MAG: valine--tRNA ligase [Fibromonadaceae bacterium]|jgi:valyl-tRNA synthetase|nr:valine--tRNA ligase [Fibromonadaceae bacterium]
METRYNHKEIEEKWLKNWDEQKNFKPRGTQCAASKHFSVVIPPPNVTGALHLGHALNNTIQDILVRYNRKLGKNTLWIPGTDHAGIATQAVVEKRLMQEEKKTRHDLGREELVKRIWEWKDEYETRITNQLKLLGSSCDWDKQRFTLDPICTKAVRHAFFNLFKKGLIYRGKRLVNWDTHLHTAVADDEIYHETVKGHFWTFKYPLADGSGYIPVATTRPETILGDTAVAVHPEDERYKQFIGKTLLVPFVNREISVIADDILVDKEFGTGSVKVTPAHDPNDYATGLRHKLPMLNILNEDGTLNENAGEFKGLKGEKARAAVVEGLEKSGLLLKVEDHEMQVGKSDRSKTIIEPYLSDQWFVKMDMLAERAMQAVESGEIKFTPARYAKNYLNWLGEKRDWCISRQLWWGHQIPIWYSSTRPNINRPDIHYFQAENGDWLVCSLEEDLDENSIEGLKLVRDPDVLDTWFSSALWPHSTMGWPGETEDLKEFYPTSVLVTARDIISLWVARMVVFSQENMDKIPFSDVYINPTILDGNGRRMSKSHGNGVDPLDIIEKYGADSLRFVMCSICTENQDARLPVKKEKQEDGREINISEKFEVGRNFGNKLWNAARFLKPHISSVESGELRVESLEDKWVLSRLNTVIRGVRNAFENYRFSEYASLVYHFVWDDLCSRYLEIKKGEISKESSTLLSHSLYTALDLLHPIMPFITEELNAILFPNSERVILREWPSADENLINAEIEKQFEDIFAIVEAVRSVRGRYSIAPSQKITATIRTSANLESSRNMIKDLSGLSEFDFGENLQHPAFSASAVIPGGEVFVPLEGILNKETEIARLKKEIEKAESFITSLNKKLSNESFVKNAPVAVIDGERQKLATQKDIVEKSQAMLRELEQ